MSWDERDAWAVLLPGFSGTTPPDEASEYFANGLLGVCAYGNNVVEPGSLAGFAARIRELAPHALLAIDEEGGDVTRLHYDAGSPYPGNAVLGRLGSRSMAAATGARVGADLRSLGFNLDLAPSVDINSNPDNPVIGVRSFGVDPHLVADLATAWIDGLQGQGVAACAKHFPGHGDTATDSHLALPRMDLSAQELRGRELLPFRAAVRAQVAAIMTSHILIPSLDPSAPATFSHAALTGLLRGELGFDGVVVTDALDMRGAAVPGGIPQACVQALAAGSDLLCLGPASTPKLLAACVEAIRLGIGTGQLSTHRLREAARRVRRLADRYQPDSVARDASTGTLSTGMVSSAFRVGHEFPRWLREHPDFQVWRVNGGNSEAMGHVPWGPFTAHSERFNVDGTEAAPTSGRPVLAVGRLLHLRPDFQAQLLRWRTTGHPVALIEMGWPPTAEDPLRLDTYGASRLVGEALLRWLHEQGVATGAR